MSPTACRLDHLVICANELQAGVAWFHKLSGITLPAGGSHPLMGTHNHLSALSENAFLEIIATDLSNPVTSRKRWFNLDDTEFQQQLRKSPRLSTWVVATDDLEAALSTVKNSGIDAGIPVEQARDDLKWQIAIRSDGTLACDGVFPILIQWPESVNPVARMQDQGLRLNHLQLQHPQADQIRAALQAIGMGMPENVTEGDACLQAEMSAGNHSFRL